LTRASPADDRVGRVFQVGDDRNLKIHVTDVGATWTSCRVAMQDGNVREAVLGHPSSAHYLSEPGYFGALIGRYANRIADGRFLLDGREFLLVRNEGRHHLHGGSKGFHSRRWDLVSLTDDEVTLRHISPDGDQGYPGELEVEVRYKVLAERALRIEFLARCDKPCPVNLTSHPYFNLDGDARSALDHYLWIAAHRYLPVNDEMIPEGNLEDVAETPFDFRVPRRIRERLHQGVQQALAGGYDHCFVLDHDRAAGPGDGCAARLWSSDRRLALHLYTDYPGLQVYSGNHLPKSVGRDGRSCAAHSGIALEAQYLPDSPNHPAWSQPSCVLRPGQRMQHFIEFRFETS